MIEIYHLLQLFYYLDLNESGTLDRNEIFFGFVAISKGSEKIKIRCIFDVVDEDKNHSLS